MTTPAIQPVSTEPLTTLTPEQKKKRYEQLRKRLGKPRLEVKGLPGWHYFFAHKTDDAEMVRLDGLEYHIVKEPNAKEVLAGTRKPIVQASGLREDGTYQIGDVILVACPQDVYDFLMLDEVRKGEEMVQSAVDDFKLEAEKSGVPVFETTGKGKIKGKEE